jgi:hypothetical protein
MRHCSGAVCANRALRRSASRSNPIHRNLTMSFEIAFGSAGINRLCQDSDPVEELMSSSLCDSQFRPSQWLRCSNSIFRLQIADEFVVDVSTKDRAEIVDIQQIRRIDRRRTGNARDATPHDSIRYRFCQVNGASRSVNRRACFMVGRRRTARESVKTDVRASMESRFKDRS